MQTRIPAYALVALMLCLPTLGAATDQNPPDDNTIIYLGKIGVTGKTTILETLQAIKLSLKQPYSADPKDADKVVCRLEPVAGTNTKQWLTCGTNRAMLMKRSVMVTTMMATSTASNGPASRDGTGPSDPSCNSDGCYGEVLGVLDEAINYQPGRYLHVLVNGPELRGLLEKLPDPAPDAATRAAPVAATAATPVAATTTVPAAATQS